MNARIAALLVAFSCLGPARVIAHAADAPILGVADATCGDMRRGGDLHADSAHLQWLAGYLSGVARMEHEQGVYESIAAQVWETEMDALVEYVRRECSGQDERTLREVGDRWVKTTQ